MRTYTDWARHRYLHGARTVRVCTRTMIRSFSRVDAKNKSTAHHCTVLIATSLFVSLLLVGISVASCMSDSQSSRHLIHRECTCTRYCSLQPRTPHRHRTSHSRRMQREMRVRCIVYTGDTRRGDMYTKCARDRLRADEAGGMVHRCSGARSYGVRSYPQTPMTSDVLRCLDVPRRACIWHVDETQHV